MRIFDVDAVHPSIRSRDTFLPA